MHYYVFLTRHYEPKIPCHTRSYATVVISILFAATFAVGRVKNTTIELKYNISHHRDSTIGFVLWLFWRKLAVFYNRTMRHFLRNLIWGVDLAKTIMSRQIKRHLDKRMIPEGMWLHIRDIKIHTPVFLPKTTVPRWHLPLVARQWDNSRFQ